MGSKGIPFYRCTLCHNVISLWDIYKGSHNCPKCGGARITPTNLSLWEKIVQVMKHPKVWRWNEENF
jgi:hypothetical protein